MKTETAFALGLGVLSLVLVLRRESQQRPGRPWARPPTEIRRALQSAADRAEVPVELLIAVAYVESRYNPKAVSRVGAMGLMQLMPGTAAGLKVADPYDPRQNARGGAELLERLHSRFGNWPTALAAYNWGPGNVKRSPRPSSWPSSTQRYVHRVLQIRREA